MKGWCIAEKAVKQNVQEYLQINVKQLSKTMTYVIKENISKITKSNVNNLNYQKKYENYFTRNLMVYKTFIFAILSLLILLKCF